MEDLANSKFKKKKIDEQAALLDMQNRFQKMSTLEIQESDDFEIEDSRSLEKELPEELKRCSD